MEGGYNLKNFDSVSIVGMSGEKITCGHIECTETTTLRLNNTIKLTGDYVYQVILKSKNQSSITLKIKDQEFELSSKIEWKRFVQKFSVEDNESSYIDLIFNSGEYWFYNAKLETGTIATAWTPAPEDFDQKLYSIQSNFEQRADSIELSVASKQDILPAKIRYIRDYLALATDNTESCWVECKVMTNNTNIVSGEQNVACLTSTILSSDIELKNIKNFVDEDLETSVITTDSDWHYIQIDLGEENAINTGYITIYHKEGKSYNHKLVVSLDGNNWYELFNSEKNGTYDETSDGKTYLINDGLVNKNLSFIKVNLDSITQKVQDAENNYASIVTDVDSIVQRVESVENTAQEIQDDTIPALTDSVNKKISEIKLNSDQISQQVTSIQDTVEKQAQEILDANGWRVSLANIGAYDDSYATEKVSMSLTHDGMTITRSASEGYRTQFTGDTIKIEYDNGRGTYENAMSIEKDLMYLTRLKVKNGVDHYTIKEIPMTYTFGDSKIGSLVFISSSGNS